MLCLTCYRQIPPGSSSCPRCEATDAGKGSVETPPEEGRECPWEERSRLGLFNAFGETLQKSIFKPTEFFRSLPPEGNTGSALLYAVIVGTLSAAVAMMWQQAASYTAVWGESVWEIPPLAGYVWYAGLALVPLFVVLAVYVRSAVLHVSLMIVGGPNRGFAATLKTVSYATSANAFNVFPFCGAPIAIVWRVVLVVIGLREVHGISTGRAFIAWLLPFIVVGCFVGALVAGLLLLLAKLFPAVMGDIVAV